MAARTVDVRWIRRYQVFFVAGGCILVFQIFLAYVFLVISDANERNTYEHLSGRGNEHVEGLDEKHRLQNVSAHRFNSPYLASEFEESSNNVLPALNKHKVPPDKTFRLQLEDLDFVPLCDIDAKEAISAIHRAKSQQCKQMIANVTCLISRGQLYPKSLPHSCPSDFIVGKSLGCYDDDGTARLLSGYSAILKSSNSPQNCISICLQNGHLYAGVQFGSECFCGNDVPPAAVRKPDPSCNMKCAGDPKQPCGGYYKMNVYQTGLSKFQPQSALEDEGNPLSSLPAPAVPSVRIAYLLTLNGRSTRQVHRLVRALFHRDHFFLIHVDARQDYLFRELLSLELRLPNVRLSRRRQATIWGGASLISTLLDSMQQLLDSGWQWDFIINLSESDYPIKTNQQLVEFLSINRDKNFVKSHGRQVSRFINKQGLDKSFVECEARMWRVGDRTLPQGIVMDGGSDWLVLSRAFVSYVASPDKDELVSGLLHVFRHTLLPAESFFHTVLRNSVHCSSYIDNNLHTTNWKRSLGCRCQYRHVVDWCGCSPNDFLGSDITRLMATRPKQLYFARKFEPIVDQTVVNRLDEWLYGAYPTNLSGLHSYWENIYHHSDLSPPPDDALVTVATSLTRLAIRFSLKTCHRVRSNVPNNKQEQNSNNDQMNRDHSSHDERGNKMNEVENDKNLKKDNIKKYSSTRGIGVGGNSIKENEIGVNDAKAKEPSFQTSQVEIKMKKVNSDAHLNKRDISNKGDGGGGAENLVNVRENIGRNVKNGDNNGVKYGMNRDSGNTGNQLDSGVKNGNQLNGDGRNRNQLERRSEISFQDNNVEQMFVFKHDDVYKGTVIQYKLTLTEYIDSANDVELEEDHVLDIQTLVQPKSVFNILKTDAFSRKLKRLEVSSSYDQKEQMSRDFLHVLGPYSEPVLIHSWLSDAAYNVTYLWIDPTNVLASVTSAAVDENTTIDHVKSGLKPPLLPGEWKVKLVWNSQVYAETGFLVSPLEFLNKTPLTQTQVTFIHGGAYPYPADTKGWLKFVEGSSRRESLERKAALNSRRVGLDLQQWIDSLVPRWYTLGESCVLSPVDISLQCSSHRLKSCVRTPWSSAYPDPKSAIVSINGTSGYLNRW